MFEKLFKPSGVSQFLIETQQLPIRTRFVTIHLGTTGIGSCLTRRLIPFALVDIVDLIFPNSSTLIIQINVLDCSCPREKTFPVNKWNRLTTWTNISLIKSFSKRGRPYVRKEKREGVNEQRKTNKQKSMRNFPSTLLTCPCSVGWIHTAAHNKYRRQRCCCW